MKNQATSLKGVYPNKIRYGTGKTTVHYEDNTWSMDLIHLNENWPKKSGVCRYFFIISRYYLKVWLDYSNKK